MIVKIKAVNRGSFDLIVCGGGVAGIAAAITAGRSGMKVAIIEASGCFGGTATSGRVSHLLGGRRWDAFSHTMVREIGGLFDELTDRLINEGKAIDPDTINVEWNPFGWYPRMAAGIACDNEYLKCLFDSMLIESGVTSFLLTRVVAVKMADGSKITDVVLHGKDGFFSLSAPLFIDATGDGDFATICGCPMEKGRQEDGLMTPSSLIMHLDHVDGDTLVAYQNRHQSPKLVEIIKELQQKGIWDFPFDIFVTVQLNDKDVFMVNTLRQTGVDGTDTVSITKALMDGRKESLKLFGIIKEYFPGFSRARIRLLGDSVGIRETRRIVGISHVTLSDALSGRRYPDEIGKTTYNFDLPDPLKPSYDPMMGNASYPQSERTHVAIYVPYGALVPRGVKNLIACGRLASVDREVLGALRVMGPCMMLGQAAGFASVVALSEGLDYAEVDGRVVRTMLVDAGCLL